MTIDSREGHVRGALTLSVPVPSLCRSHAEKRMRFWHLGRAESNYPAALWLGSIKHFHPLPAGPRRFDGASSTGRPIRFDAERIATVCVDEGVTGILWKDWRNHLFPPAP